MDSFNYVIIKLIIIIKQSYVDVKNSGIVAFEYLHRCVPFLFHYK